MSFTINLFKKHVEDIGTTLRNAIITMDPETATEAQIQTFSQELDQASLELAEARKRYQKEKKEADEILALYDTRLKAAGILQNKLDAADVEDKEKLSESLETLLTSLEEMIIDVDREKAEAEDAKVIMENANKTVEDASQVLKQARQRLQRAATAMAKANFEKEQAVKAAKRAEKVAGINKEKDTLNVALSAIEQKTEKMQIEADANKIKAEILTKTNINKTDANIEAALEQAAGKPFITSPTNRLEALRAARPK